MYLPLNTLQRYRVIGICLLIFDNRALIKVKRYYALDKKLFASKKKIFNTEIKDLIKFYILK